MLQPVAVYQRPHLINCKIKNNVTGTVFTAKLIYLSLGVVRSKVDGPYDSGRSWVEGDGPFLETVQFHPFDQFSSFGPFTFGFQDRLV